MKILIFIIWYHHYYLLQYLMYVELYLEPIHTSQFMAEIYWFRVQLAKGLVLYIKQKKMHSSFSYLTKFDAADGPIMARVDAYRCPMITNKGNCSMFILIIQNSLK